MIQITRLGTSLTEHLSASPQSLRYNSLEPVDQQLLTAAKGTLLVAADEMIRLCLGTKGNQYP